MDTKLKDLTGQKFGIWLVIKQAPRRDNKTRWLCECQVCGETRSKRSTTLRISLYGACDGRHLERYHSSAPSPLRKPSGYAAGTERYTHTRLQAHKRGLTFELSREEWEKLVKQYCHYCGKPPAQYVIRRHFNGSFVCNGLDRINSAHGYTLTNCVPCCGLCNLMKQDLPYSDFLGHIAQIAKRHPVQAKATTQEKHKGFGNGGPIKPANIEKRDRKQAQQIRQARMRKLGALYQEGKTLLEISTLLNLGRMTVYRGLITGGYIKPRAYKTRTSKHA